MHSSRTIGASVSLKVELYCVYFSVNQSRKVLVKKTKNKQAAIELANGAANYLGVPLISYLNEG